MPPNNPIFDLSLVYREVSWLVREVVAFSLLAAETLLFERQLNCLSRLRLGATLVVLVEVWLE
jgi:hypothetical protein